MKLRRLVGVVAAAASAFVLLPTAPASASSAPIYPTIAPAWGRGSLKIVRTAWTVSVTGTVTDTRADGDCVYVEAVLEVDSWTDPDGRTPDTCGKGTSRSVNINLTPGKGSKLSRIRVRVCAADAFRDSCQEGIWTVPSEQPIRADLRGRVDSYRTMSMSSFKSAQRSRPAPFDWSNDGCSSPTGDAPAGFNFLDACNRHDFGYRNYGKGSLRTAPYDSVRELVDARFLEDMRAKCRSSYPTKVTSCYSWAQIYHQAVRSAGGRAFYRNN